MSELAYGERLREDTYRQEVRECLETVEGESSLDCRQCSMWRSSKRSRQASQPLDLPPWGDALSPELFTDAAFSWAQRQEGRDISRRDLKGSEQGNAPQTAAATSCGAHATSVTAFFLSLFVSFLLFWWPVKKNK